MQMVDDILTVQKCVLAASAKNTEVNLFIKHKKLKHKHKNCTQLHIGNKCGDCEKQYVHGVPINQEQEVKYLGDMIHQNGKPKSTIMKRVNRGLAIVGQILALLKDLPVGYYRVQIGLEQWQAWLKNGTLFNSEVWHIVKIVTLHTLWQ